MITKYIRDKDPFAGFPVEHMLVKRVPTLLSISLSALLTYRDMMPFYFTAHFRSAGTLINTGIHCALTENIKHLSRERDTTLIREKLETCQYSHSAGFTF